MKMLHGKSNMQLNIIASKCSLDLLLFLMSFFKKLVTQLNIRCSVLQNKKCMQLPFYNRKEISLFMAI